MLRYLPAKVTRVTVCPMDAPHTPARRSATPRGFGWRRLLGAFAFAGALMTLPASASAGPLASRPAPEPHPRPTPRPLIGTYIEAPAGGGKDIGVASL